MTIIRYSVIVPARDASDTVESCLVALSHQDIDRAHFEIILVDDGSTDDTAACARRVPGVRVLTQPPSGPATARNYGAREARGDVLVFTDADTEPKSDWLRCLTRPFEDPKTTGSKGAYRTRQRELIARFVQLEYEARYERMRRLPTIDFVDTYAAAFRKDSFLLAGGFAPFFPTACVEDQEFSFRMAKGGAKMVFVPEAIVYHRHASTLPSYLRKKFKIGYWKIRVLKIHPKKVWCDSHTPQFLKIEMLTALVLVISSGIAVVEGCRSACYFAMGSGAGFLIAFTLELKRQITFGLDFFPMAGVAFLRSLALTAGLAWGAICAVNPIKLHLIEKRWNKIPQNNRK